MSWLAISEMTAVSLYWYAFRHNSFMPCAMVILTWVDIAFVNILIPSVFSTFKVWTSFFNVISNRQKKYYRLSLRKRGILFQIALDIVCYELMSVSVSLSGFISFFLTVNEFLLVSYDFLKRCINILLQHQNRLILLSKQHILYLTYICHYT